MYPQAYVRSKVQRYTCLPRNEEGIKCVSCESDYCCCWPNGLELPVPLLVGGGAPNPKAEGVVPVGIPPNIGCPAAGCGACGVVVVEVFEISPNLNAENDDEAPFVGVAEVGVVV
jgi:hypothetical protein